MTVLLLKGGIDWEVRPGVRPRSANVLLFQVAVLGTPLRITEIHYNPQAGQQLEFVELSHWWGPGIPIFPGDHDIRIERVGYHARDGVMAQRVTTNMHNGTHINAPIHLIQGGADISALSIDRFFGNGVVLSIPKNKWELVTEKDLASAHPAIREGDIVLIVTGWHKHYSESQNYFGNAPGLSKGAAEWLVAKGVRLVGIDVQALDHPLGTVLASHGPGPIQPFLNDEYKAETGRDILDDFPYWEPAHNILMTNGIPGIENIGGDIDKVTGKRCTFFAFPWRWPNGEGCALRVVAVIDPKQQFRFETGR